MNESSISVVLVDDHPIVRSGIATLFSMEQAITVVGEAGSVAEARTVIADTNPDIAVLDLRLPDGPGLDVARWMSEGNRATRCVVLTSVPTDRALVASYETGAVMAFLTKEADIRPLVDAVYEVANGRSLLDAFAVRDATARLHEYGLSHLDSLSPREREMADLVASGFSDAQIAERCHISLSTVRNGLSAAYTKLNLDTRTQLVRLLWMSRIDADVV